MLPDLDRRLAPACLTLLALRLTGRHLVTEEDKLFRDEDQHLAMYAKIPLLHGKRETFSDLAGVSDQEVPDLVPTA